MIKLQNLTKSFSEAKLFENLSYDFPEKGLVYLTGESGKGKTTLLRMIAGLDTAYTGTISREGEVSYLFQDRRLFPVLTALDNVAIAHENGGADKATAREKARDLLLALNLSDEDMQKRPSQLSGGMQQRVAFARALLFDAPILLLDEPFKELDEKNRQVITHMILEEAERRLVVLVNHDALHNLPQDARHLTLA